MDDRQRSSRTLRHGGRRRTRGLAMLAALVAIAVAAACTPTTGTGGTTTTTPSGNGWTPGQDTTSFIEGDPGDAPDLDTAPDLRAMALAPSNQGVASVTRAQIKQRAESWLNNTAITYSQHAYWTNQYGRYRKDCSGFISMALGLTSSLDTGSLPSVGVPIAWADLRPGDFVNRSNRAHPNDGHVQMFMGWTDSSKTAFVLYHQHGHNVVNGVRVPGWPQADTRTVANAQANDYHPFRYRHVVEDSPALPSGDPVNPIGALDVVQGAVGAAGATGWALDMDNPNASIQVQIRSDGNLVATQTANIDRPDVAAAFRVPAAHGFLSLWNSTPGTHTITATAVNIGSGSNVVIGTKTVVVSSPTPSNGATPVGANYEGPGYVCSSSGATGTFFSAQQFMGAGYPAGSWRQIGPSRTGVANTITLYENGLPLTVPLGSICDARHDPGDANRTNKAGFGPLNPVPAGFNGSGFICNAGGSYGLNGSNGQAFFATYVGQVGPWDANSVAVTFNGTPWLVPRVDVCPVPAMPVVSAGYEGPAFVCAVNGVDAEFFGAVRHLDFGYPRSSWRQAGPQVFGVAGTQAFYEDGLALKVPAGSLCSARLDPMDANRTNRAGFSNLTPVAAGFSGSGYVCNAGGTLGRNGSATQSFAAGYRGQVGPWDANNVALYLNGTPYLVPRPDVCA